MQAAGRILSIINKELTVELRQKQAMAGIFLFTASVVFLVYKSFPKMEGISWDVMLWIILLFSGLNAIVKSFVGEGSTTDLFYYQLYNPLELIVAKLLFNFVYLLLIFALIYLGFSFFMEDKVKDYGTFFSGAVLGVIGINVIYTFVSSIAKGEGNSGNLLMSILALPLTLPIVLLLVKITAVSMRLIQDTAVGDDLLLLGGIDLLLLGLVLILFPTLWKS